MRQTKVLKDLVGYILRGNNTSLHLCVKIEMLQNRLVSPSTGQKGERTNFSPIFKKPQPTWPKTLRFQTLVQTKCILPQTLLWFCWIQVALLLKSIHRLARTAQTLQLSFLSKVIQLRPLRKTTHVGHLCARSGHTTQQPSPGNVAPFQR